MTAKEIKKELLDHCKAYIQNRFEKINQTIKDIEDSLDDESKNSAGDKHETGRAMLHIDRENAGKQLQEIESVQLLLPKVDITTTSDYVRLGSLVYTSQGVFFISISVGNVMVGKTNYICVALQAPLGELLKGATKGTMFVFRDKNYVVTSIK